MLQQVLYMAGGLGLPTIVRNVLSFSAHCNLRIFS